MTTPNPWERLREAAQMFCDWHLLSQQEFENRHGKAEWRRLMEAKDEHDLLAGEVRDALDALPATPPQQPVPDAERERAIETLLHVIACAAEVEVIDEIEEAEARAALALMRSAPAPQPVPAPSIGESLASAGTHYVNPRTMQPVSTKVPAPPASDWRTDLGVTGNIGTGTVLP